MAKKPMTTFYVKGSAEFVRYHLNYSLVSKLEARLRACIAPAVASSRHRRLIRDEEFSQPVRPLPGSAFPPRRKRSQHRSRSSRQEPHISPEHDGSGHPTNLKQIRLYPGKEVRISTPRAPPVPNSIIELKAVEGKLHPSVGAPPGPTALLKMADWAVD